MITPDQQLHSELHIRALARFPREVGESYPEHRTTSSPCGGSAWMGKLGYNTHQVSLLRALGGQGVMRITSPKGTLGGLPSDTSPHPEWVGPGLSRAITAPSLDNSALPEKVGWNLKLNGSFAMMIPDFMPPFSGITLCVKRLSFLNLSGPTGRRSDPRSP